MDRQERIEYLREYNARLDVRIRKSEWRRRKYAENAAFREKEKAYAREYRRRKEGKAGTETEAIKPD